MTPEQVKKAARLIEELEFLEQVTVNIGREDLMAIVLSFRSNKDMPITEPVMKIIRSGIEQALSEEIAKCRQQLAKHYNVRTAA
ncbi:hypothetical protein [Marinobacterium sp. MBR-109]|jgi:hypothetical protein|uniref:hypothetical protein n=1 Tax=Marinobacterium sp. MBR-109 TaxID=3156462 RepID=UPI003394F1E8